MQNASDVILILDEDDRVRYASTSADRVLATRLVGTPIVSLVPPEEAPRGGRRAGADARSGHPERQEHWRMLAPPRRADRGRGPAQSTFGADPTVAGLVLTLARRHRAAPAGAGS
ncbi:hypothetical protein GCM10020229_60350 [Kitasatospora albolonga]|uniref:PAS domain-containing protein n=1 Tax=Kitasatospora albolonga TaxID=68173 RepID=UPI0031EE7F9A